MAQKGQVVSFLPALTLQGWVSQERRVWPNSQAQYRAATLRQPHPLGPEPHHSLRALVWILISGLLTLLNTTLYWGPKSTNWLELLVIGTRASRPFLISQAALKRRKLKKFHRSSPSWKKGVANLSAQILWEKTNLWIFPSDSDWLLKLPGLCTAAISPLVHLPGNQTTWPFCFWPPVEPISLLALLLLSPAHI